MKHKRIKRQNMTEAQLDYAESLIKENADLLWRHTSDHQPHDWEVCRIYKRIGYKTRKMSHGRAHKVSTLDRLLGVIKSAKAAKARLQVKREEFRAIAIECVALGATPEEIKQFCRDNVFRLMKESALGNYRSSDYCEGFPGQFSDAYKTVAENKKRSQAAYGHACRLERDECYWLVDPSWWITTVRFYRHQLKEENEQ